MTGLVSEIQALVIDPAVRVSDLLRRVKLAAVKLQLDDTVDWVDRELRGYGEDEEAPVYRRTFGELKAHTPYHGVRPVTGHAPWMDKVCERSVADSISKVEILAGNGKGDTASKVSGSIENTLNKLNNSVGTQYYVHIPQSVFVNILDQVRNLVLDWAIGLEKAGILGEGIGFSAEEKQKAVNSATSISITNFSGHLHNGDVTGSQNRTMIESTDNSTNVIKTKNVFQQVAQAIEANVLDASQRQEMLSVVQEMEAAQGTPEYIPLFQRYVGYAADYMTVLGPFLPALAGFAG